MRRFVEHQLPQLLNLLYGAAVDETRWSEFLDALSKAFDQTSGTLYLYDTEQERPTWTLLVNHDPAFVASLAAHYVGLNPYQTPDLLKLRPGDINLATEATRKEVVERSVFYNEWMRPQGIASDHPAVTLFNNGREVALLALALPRWGNARHRAAYRRRLELLTPHIVRAMGMSRQLAAARTMQNASLGALDTLGRAAILVDRAGRPLFLNRAASDLLAAPKGPLSVDTFGRLVTREPGLDLGSAVVRAMATGVAAGPLKLKCRADAAGHVVWIVPVPVAPVAPSETIVGLAAAGGGQPAALVLCAPAAGTLAFPPAMIASELGLTPAESRLVAALVAGRSLVDIARDTGPSHNTLRNQLASVFAKTGTRRQTELVALVVGRLAGPRW